MTWAAWLLSLIGPLALRVLVTLGVGVLTVTGLNAAVGTALGWLTSAVGGLPADLANVLALGGVFTGMSYIAGAFASRVAMAGVSGVVKRFFLK
ncbi:DUF2523 family protein [Burkholderia stagnalis]|uniref:DUF2523 family protein n=1 Tax=Burkholderia stagnalis TaxID=1503054 RepID=UPI000753674D|nr:DUF2523 family protein [Burkholderia stagnalis]KVL90150.1 cobalt ABC transporter permease [Burkholderia stagnalis]KVL95488.1 cobalt ABC transporter permease [Burkholderia stagnalis]KVM14538.1 cobalt ABC transporter permease [Burkholderia stagnalis]